MKAEAPFPSTVPGLCRRCHHPLVPGRAAGLCVHCLTQRLVRPVPTPEAADSSAAGLPPGFEFVEVLGRGGMGEVLLVYQQSLSRYVALKRIVEAVAGDVRRQERFRRESRAAARLSHPGIVSILEVGMGPGAAWYAMEYIEGGDLSQHLKRRDGRLPWSEAVGLLATVAAAIQHAHEKGIAHRDLKPSNILLDAAGAPKVADFGLAWLAEREMSELTLTGEVLGTLAYLPPESLTAAGRSVDPRRGDIYGLGALLFRLVAGRPPFTGETPAEILAAIGQQAVPRLADVAGEPVPGRLEEICAQCLAKTPAERFGSAEEITLALRALETNPSRRMVRPRRRVRAFAVMVLAIVALGALGEVVLWRLARTPPPVLATTEPVVAVAAMESIGSDETASMLAAALPDELVATLMRVADLKVVTARSTRALGDNARDYRAIRRSLGADAVLTGKIRRWQDRVWVAVQLIDTADGTVRWSRTYIARETNALNVQTDIATDVAVNLHRRLRSDFASADRGTSSKVPAAEASFVQARTLLNDASASVDYLHKAERLLQGAVAADPGFALAYAELSTVDTQMYIWGSDRSERRLARGLEAAQNALRLNPDLVEAEIALGLYYYRGTRDYGTALEHYRRALALAPSNPEVLQALAQVERRRGDFEAAGRDFETALRLDPLNAILAYNTADTYLRLRDYPHASALLDRSLQLMPRHVALLKLRGDLFVAWKGDLGPMRDDIEHRDPSLPTPDLYVMDRIDYLILSHRVDEALAVLRASHLAVLEGEAIYLTRGGYEALLLELAGQYSAAQAAAREALPSIEAALAQHPNDPRILLLAGQMRAILGDLPGAEKLARRAVTPGDLAAVDAFDRGIYLRSIAIMEANAGDDDGARKTLRDLLREPNQASPHFIALHPALARFAKDFE